MEKSRKQCKYTKCFFYGPKSRTHCSGFANQALCYNDHCNTRSGDHYGHGRLKKGKESSILRSCFKLVRNELPFVPTPPFSAEELDMLAKTVNTKLVLTKQILGHLQKTSDDIGALQHLLLSKEKSEKERKCGG